MRTLKQILSLIRDLGERLQDLTAEMDATGSFNEDECCEILDKLHPLLTNLLGGADVDVAIELGDTTNESIQGETTNRTAS